MLGITGIKGHLTACDPLKVEYDPTCLGFAFTGSPLAMNSGEIRFLFLVLE